MDVRKYARAFDQVERDYEHAVAAFGVPFEASESCLDRVAPKLPRRVLAIAKMVKAPCGAAGFLLHAWPAERGSERRHFLSTCAVRGIAISASIPTKTTTSIF